MHNSALTKKLSHCMYDCIKSDAESLLRMPVGMLIGDNCSHIEMGCKASQLPYIGFTYLQPSLLQSTVCCLGVKDTAQTLLETLVSLLKKRCCHKKCCGCMGCAAV